MAGANKRLFRIRTDDLATREFEKQTIVLDLRSSTYLSLNASATLLWHRLQGGSSRDELLKALQDQFDIDEESAERDVDTFLSECARRDLLASGVDAVRKTDGGAD